MLLRIFEQINYGLSNENSISVPLVNYYLHNEENFSLVYPEYLNALTITKTLLKKGEIKG
jgi:hypothetical protein